MELSLQSQPSSAEAPVSAHGPTTAVEPVLAARDLRFEYPGGVVALGGVSYGFARGRRTAVLGRNGSGKTTLFSLLGALECPASGEVLLDGTPVDYSKEGLRTVRRTVGLIFQDPDSQVFSASVREDVSFGPMNMHLPLDEVAARVEEALAALDVADLADRPVHALSYGQRKRVSIAGVMAMRPEILVLDEPLAGLDPPSAQGVVGILEQMSDRGVTLVLATHDIDFAYEWADDAIVLDRGRLVAAGPVAEVLALPEVTAALGTTPIVYEVARRLDLLRREESPRTRAELLEALESVR